MTAATANMPQDRASASGLKGRFGGLAFAGVGGVSSGLACFGDYRILPAAGAGLPIAVSKDIGMKMSIGLARRRTFEGPLYLRRRGVPSRRKRRSRGC